MIQQPIYIVDELEEVVATVSDKLLPSLQLIDPNIQAINYYADNILKIIETLQQKDGSDSYRYYKYPAVFLLQDFEEMIGAGLGISTTTKGLQLLIVTSTDPTYKRPERMDRNFKPILYPIWQQLIYQLFRSGKVMASSENQIMHTKRDCIFLGSLPFGTNKNTTNDFLDAIAITNLQLKFYNKKCLN